MNIIEVLFLGFSLFSIGLSIYFFSRKQGDKVANSILGLYLLLFSYNLFYNVLFWSGYLYKGGFVNLVGTITIPWALYPALIYLYIKRTVGGKKINRIDVLHFIPVVLVILNSSRFHILGTAEKMDVLKNGLIQHYFFIYKYNLIYIILLMVVYTIFIYFKYRDHKNLNLNTKRWFMCIIGSFAMYIGLLTVYFYLSVKGIIQTRDDYFISGGIVFIICLITYFAVWQPYIFDGLPIKKIIPFVKYKGTGLSKELSLDLKEKLLEYIDLEKPFYDSNLRLEDLAKQLNISRHHLSQVINENFQTNFSSFINSFRINEAKKMILMADDLNITQIIYRCGFNNRASFYKAFRNQTQYTPKEYKLKYSKKVSNG